MELQFVKMLYDIYNRLGNKIKSGFVFSLFAENQLFGTYTDLKWVV